MQLIVNYKAMELNTNFNEVKNFVIGEVEKYSIEVVESNVKEAKQVMADLNKVKAEIASKYSNYIKDISQPIEQLKSEKKELENIITQGREKIADGVAVFESKRLEAIKETIEAYRLEICKIKEIEPNLLVVNDLVKLSAVTTNGTITKATKEAIDLRLQTIENELLKAKLEAEEKAKRDREIAEKARLEAEERARQREIELQARAEREKQEALAKAEREKQQEIQELKNSTISKMEKVPPKMADDGKMIYTIQAKFEVKAQANLDDDVLINALNKKLQIAGITTCVDIKVL